MKIKIQHFTLSLFLLMSLGAIVLWSLSLFLLNGSLYSEKVKLYRQNWQLQLDQLQVAQALWLQQRLIEVSRQINNTEDPQQRLLLINQYYHRYPQLRLIQINDIVTGNANQAASISSCLKPTARKTPSSTINPIACFFNSQPVIGMSTEIISPTKPQELVLLMDYFSFMRDLEQLTGKHFHAETNSSGVHGYVENGVVNELQQITFEFEQRAVNFGSLSVSLPAAGFFAIWKQQALWVIPLFLIMAFILYQLLFRALIQPLLMITGRVKKVVLTRRPGNSYDGKFLAPGLLLLHKYCMHLSHMTKHDPLTGLNNQVIFEERLQQAIVEGKRSGRKYALVLVDINHFYKVNKKFGNYIGDGLLKQLAKRLTDSMRESDSLARLEKDNFALLLEFTDEEQINTLVEKLHQSLSTEYTVYGRKIKVAISIGVAFYPDHAQKMVELELKASEAMLEAHKGDWPVVITQKPSDEADYTGLSQIQTLRQALENNEFKLVYQPVMDLKLHATSYFEALLRWKQPDMHTQSIEKTIALAEKNQLIKPLSQWIIETACDQLKNLQDNQLQIAVNLSMIDLHDGNLPDRIEQILQRCGVDPAKLMVEITEGQIMQEPDQVIDILTRLSDMGISLSIDDFGTGQASLTYLKRLPVEKIKIDQSFVKDMVTDEEDRAIVEATIKLAHTLGIQVVAEGVESAEIRALLVQMDCDYVQGYYISRPIEQEMIPDWIVNPKKCN